MLPVLTIFIVFLVVLTFYIKKNDAAQDKIQEEFWEKERKSNAVRKKDISKLDYITIPLDKIPQPLHTSTEEALFALANKPMLNLTGISNTDLKLNYGTANLEILSEYDYNFSEMVRLLPQYATELFDAGQTIPALELLEFAISCNADSKFIYLLLAEQYRKENDAQKLAWLAKASENLPHLTKLAVQKELNLYDYLP